jgi:hypothetical protein
MTASVVDNGVNVEALLARDAFADAPEIARFQWRSTVSWITGTHSRSEVETFFGFAEEQQHRSTFDFDIDHPLQFAAQDNGITPVEYELVALGGCLTVGIAAAPSSGPHPPAEAVDASRSIGAGSVIVVIATDAPRLPG